MDCDLIKTGLLIKTVSALDTTEGMIVEERHLTVRRVNANGQVLRYADGHGGDVWFIKHDDGAVAAYWFHEIEPAKP